jgi:hypothetical protein
MQFSDQFLKPGPSKAQALLASSNLGAANVHTQQLSSALLCGLCDDHHTLQVLDPAS